MKDLFNDKSKNQFNILSGDSTDGDGSFGVGTISLDHITPVIIDPQNEDVFIDMGAMHAKSKVEKRVRFNPSKEGLDDANLYWIVWVAAGHGEQGPYFNGAAACEILVSNEERRIRPGYKSMPEHVNNLDKAMKGKFVLDNLDAKSKGLLKAFLESNHENLWKHSKELQGELSVDAE